MAYTTTRAYLELHLAVFLWGFTAILGDLIDLSALTLVWWRVFLTSMSLLAFIRIGSLYREVGWRKLLTLVGIGLLTGLHWVAFYGSIKLANASIALICMATTSLFSSLLEPLIVRSPFRWYELLLGVAILPGIWLVVDGSADSMNLGIMVGLVSAFLAALFTNLNKRYMGDTDALRVTFVELGGATVFLALLLPFFGTEPFWPDREIDWVYLLTLALLCTTLTYVLSLRALRKLSAFATNLTINLEPVYGIFLAYFLLNDAQELTPSFYLGTLIIMLAVFGYAGINRYLRRRTTSHKAV
ncbi:EamA family transporter [Lewinellaceae bacterium SD302]|nr:EamA family transporter [Lewinellaceae bacterium SD302]